MYSSANGLNWFVFLSHHFPLYCNRWPSLGPQFAGELHPRVGPGTSLCWWKASSRHVQLLAYPFFPLYLTTHMHIYTYRKCVCVCMSCLHPLGFYPSLLSTAAVGRECVSEHIEYWPVKQMSVEFQWETQLQEWILCSPPFTKTAFC